MPTNEPNALAKIYLGVGAVLGLAVLAGIAGLWLGQFGGPSLPQPQQEQQAVADPTPAPVEETPNTRVPPPPDVPLMFFVDLKAENQLDHLRTQLGLVAGAGIKRLILPIPLPWPGHEEATAVFLELMATVAEACPESKWTLYLDLNPPEDWLEAHPDDRIVAGERPMPFASLASAAWQQDLAAVLAALDERLVSAGFGDRVAGALLAALEDGLWIQSGGIDRSPVGEAGFREWLTSEYTNDAGLRAAWGGKSLTIDGVPLPDLGDRADTKAVFYDTTKRSAIDLTRYTSERTAQAIDAMTDLVKAVLSEETEVLVPYGFSLELTDNLAGHFALESLLSTQLDGFVSPVSYVNRGLGGVGGFMGPVDCVRFFNKDWYLIDDTRTGVSRDSATGELNQMKGLELKSIFNVQERNFAAAWTHGLGLAWKESGGNLAEPEMWERFGRMLQFYRDKPNAFELQTSPPAETTEWIAPWDCVLTVVVDERSRYYQHCDVPLNERILLQARDSSLQCGVPVRFRLLSDLLDERSAPSTAYLMCNAFYLTDKDRAALHQRFARERANVIWLYAPGVLDATGEVDAKHVSDTTRMPVKRFEKTGTSGSRWALGGGWLMAEQEIGAEAEWDPLFYIEGDDLDKLATYRDSGETSIAMTSVDDKWTSIFLAEPSLPPALLRELLAIAGLPLLEAPRENAEGDTLHFGADFVALHASGPGERTLNLGRHYDVHDLLDSEFGWFAKRSLPLSMESGDTRYLRVVPNTEEDPSAPQ